MDKLLIGEKLTLITVGSGLIAHGVNQSNNLFILLGIFALFLREVLKEMKVVLEDDIEEVMSSSKKKGKKKKK